MFLWAMTTISSTSKKHVHMVGNYKNTQNAEVMLLDLNPNQSQYGQVFQDQEDVSTKVKDRTSKYTGVCWNTRDKKWVVQLKYNKKLYYGGYFDDEEQAAMKVNLLCDKYEIKRKNSKIEIEPDTIQQSVKSQTSKYHGVCWKKREKCWQVRLMHNKKNYFGGHFDNEEHAAMQVNLLCDKYGIQRKNPKIIMESDVIQKVPNKTSKFTGVSWNKDCNKWQVQLNHNKTKYCGGYFDHEEHAAMKVNLICDKIEIERKNSMININLDGIQKAPNKTSKYIGVIWNKHCKKWRVQLVHNKKKLCGGYFDSEENAAMKVNLMCDKIEKERKNPMINIHLDEIRQTTKSKMHQYEPENIVNKEVKVEDEYILHRFKDECENRFIQCNDQERDIITECQNSNAKRKRKANSMIDDDVKEE